MFKTTTIINNTTPEEPSPAPEYKMFIGCIPGTASDEEILSVLSEFGDIKSLKLERRKNNKCSGYGYATVSTKEIYEKLLQSKPQFGDRQLSVLPFLEKKDLVKSQLKFNKRRIVVAQLPHSATEMDLENHFRPFGEIEKTFIVHNENDKSLLPYGHVVFKSDSGATKARNIQGHIICGKRVAIKVHKINVQKKLGSEQAAKLNKKHKTQNRNSYQLMKTNKHQENREKNKLRKMSKAYDQQRHMGVRKNKDYPGLIKPNSFYSNLHYQNVSKFNNSSDALHQIVSLCPTINSMNHSRFNLRMNHELINRQRDFSKKVFSNPKKIGSHDHLMRNLDH
jgi:RNA recognition motif-containing protein